MNFQEFSERIFPEELRPIYLIIYAFLVSGAVLLSMKFWVLPHGESTTSGVIGVVLVVIAIMSYLRWDAVLEHQKVIFRMKCNSLLEHVLIYSLSGIPTGNLLYLYIISQ